jgi:hypothetical protein
VPFISKNWSDKGRSPSVQSLLSRDYVHPVDPNQPSIYPEKTSGSKLITTEILHFCGIF